MFDTTTTQIPLELRGDQNPVQSACDRADGFDLLPFQRRFIAKAVEHSRIRTAALSLPRGNGKSSLAGHIVTRCLTPGDKLFQEGKEYVLCAASIEQARHVFKPARAALEARGGYRFMDSARSLGITHARTTTRLRVHSSNGRTAMGLVGTPIVICDEPGAWETAGGQLMWDALATAQGKPESDLRIILIGTLAPALSGWWHDLVAAGSNASTYVLSLTGDRKQWDTWKEIRRCNPLMSRFPKSRKVLREELAEAKRDTRLKARFLSYRLNLPTGDSSEMLLTLEDWEAATARPVPEREGTPTVGIDLGGGRAWSAAVGIWPNGRTEAVAVAPGIPSLEKQEERDNVPAGLYRALAAAGLLLVADGLRVPPVCYLWDAIVSRFGAIPERIICDRFRLADLEDAVNGATVVEPRITRWSDCAADIRSLRSLAFDGPLTVDPKSEPLISASLAVAMVKNDDAGNCRLVKRGSNNQARDDVAAALLLAAGGHERASKMPVVTYHHFEL